MSQNWYNLLKNDQNLAIIRFTESEKKLDTAYQSGKSFAVNPKGAGSNPLAVDTFLPPKEKQNLLHSSFFLKKFYKNSYIGVKFDGESEFDVQKMP